jgi:hypothetical protein
MRFEFYHSGLDRVPKLSVDGTVGNSVHFSHWQGNETPAEVKADTSTEIALNLVASSNFNELTQRLDLVTNNHFDTDGVLSVWTLLQGERAVELRDKLIPAAEAGDFSEFSSEDGVRASIVIQGSDQAAANNETGSPLAAQLAGAAVDDEARAYDLVLPAVERVLTRTNDYEPLWRSAWESIATAVESFERGASTVAEFGDEQLSVIALAPEVFSPSGFNPTRHSAPYTAISRYARGQIYLITTPVAGGWVYRVDYPYYSWAETIVRPRIERRDLSSFVSQLNQTEKQREGSWQLDSSEMTSAVKFLGLDGTLGTSMLAPDEVAKTLSAVLSSSEVAVASN